jgi:hypothetical protein
VIEQLVSIMINFLILVTIFVIMAVVNVLPTSSAQPTWELYENNACGISLKHPFVSDTILDNASAANNFQIHSFKDPMDPDSMNMTLAVSCIDKAIPITYEVMELAKSSLVEDSKAIVYEDISFNRTTIDGETAGSVAVNKPTGFADITEIDNIIETNHSNQTFVIKLNFAGDEGISGFYNNYKYLADNLIDSIKFLK